MLDVQTRSGRRHHAPGAEGEGARESRRYTYTNMVSARPLFGRCGRRVALAGIVKAQIGRAPPRFARMVAFFDGVGTGEASGYGWTERAAPSPKGARDRYRRQREAKVHALSKRWAPSRAGDGP